jgi:hypothetical protein
MLACQGCEVHFTAGYLSGCGRSKGFAIHNYAEQKACTVSCNIKVALENALAKTQKALEVSLAET